MSPGTNTPRMMINEYTSIIVTNPDTLSNFEDEEYTYTSDSEEQAALLGVPSSPYSLKLLPHSLVFNPT